MIVDIAPPSCDVAFLWRLTASRFLYPLAVCALHHLTRWRPGDEFHRRELLDIAKRRTLRLSRDILISLAPTLVDLIGIVGMLLGLVLLQDLMILEQLLLVRS